MAGLLEGFTGENTVKDEFGQTQADRRDPIWSGLIKAGLLAVAGGGNVMPETRAKYLAEAGGVVGDIPNQMMANRSAAAQQVLRSQQLDEGKRKVADRDRVRAYAQTPAFQEAIKAADPAEKLAIQAAIDTGDVGALNTAIGNIGKADVRQGQMANTAERLRLAQEAETRKQTAAGGWGNTLEGRMRDTLAKGKADPEFAKTDSYAEAWHYFDQNERPVDMGGGQKTILPRRADLPDYPRPGAKPAPTSPSVTNPKVEPPKPNEVIENPTNGSRTGINPKNPDEVITEFADGSAIVKDKNTGNELRREVAPPVDATARNKLVNEKVAANKIERTSTDFLAEWKRASPGQRLKAMAGGSTALIAAWTDLMAAMKGEQQYNLGVLTGPDLLILQRAINDPSTFASIFTDEKELERIINKIPAGAQATVKDREELMKPPSRFPKSVPEQFDYDVDPNDPSKLIKKPRK